MIFLSIIPIFPFLRLDGFLADIEWYILVILPLCLAIGCFIGAIFLLAASKREYSAFKQFHMVAAAHLYHGATLILLSLTLLTFLTRIFVDNSIYLALPTAFLVLVMMMFVIRPYFSEIALSYADAELR